MKFSPSGRPKTCLRITACCWIEAILTVSTNRTDRFNLFSIHDSRKQYRFGWKWIPMPNTTIQNFGIPDRVDSLWNDLDEYTSFEPLIRVKSFYTPLYSQWNEEKHCIKYTSKTNTTELASTQNQFSFHFLRNKSRSSSRVAIHSFNHSTTYYFQVGGSCSVLL